MIKLLLIYYSGQAFSRLAKDYKESPLLYALLGAGCFFTIQQVALTMLYAYAVDCPIEYVRSISQSFYGLISMGISIVLTYALFEYLEWNWKHPKEVINDDILDA